ncbi:MAG: hypothetical protein AABM42_07315, partial [Actinomycetota bacterium]
ERGNQILELSDAMMEWAIVRSWRRARWLAGVRYYAGPGMVAAGVERAIARTHAEGRVEARALPTRACGRWDGRVGRQ